MGNGCFKAGPCADLIQDKGSRLPANSEVNTGNGFQVMFRRISLACILMGMTAGLNAGEFGMNNSEFYAGSAWQRGQNHSTGTWANYSNPWDYFQPVDYARRQQMLVSANELYQRATQLEAAVRHDVHGPATEQERQSLGELHSLRLAAYQLREHLRFGIHQGDLSADLDRLNALLDQQWWKRSALKQVADQKGEIERLADRIHSSAGPRLDIANERFEPAKPAPEAAVPTPAGTKSVGLSRPNR